MNESINQSGNQSRLERHKRFFNSILEKIFTGEEAPSSMNYFD